MIEELEFTRNSGKRYRIISTVSTGYKAHEAIDTVKSLETGKRVEMKRLDLLKFMAG